MNTPSPYIVSPEWLQARLGERHMSIVDASWYLPTQARNGYDEYLQSHIPGAVFFDQDKIVDPTSDLPHSLPSPELFAGEAGALGVSDDETIIIYDGPGAFTAPRVWWMFRLMGADKVFLLDGGFDNWKTEGRPVTNEATDPAPTTFNTFYRDNQVVGFQAMMGLVQSGKCQIADARSAGRFKGNEPEPRQGMRSGHMPCAVNVPFNLLSENGYMKSVEELKQTLTDCGIDISRPVVTTCGSGVTAAVINFALASIGRDNSRLYDGSWSEWGSRDDTAIETG